MNTYDYLERIPIHADYYDALSGAVKAQSTVTIAVVDSAGTEQLAATAMTEDATAVYSYNYVVPAAGPAGVWYYTTVGTDSDGYLTVNTTYFEVKAKVAPHTLPENVREILPDLLIAEDDVGTISSGTTLTLTNAVFGVPSILQDTTMLFESTNFTFIKPRAVTLLVAASGENYIAHVHVGFSDDQLLKFIARSDRKIDDFFFGVTTPPASYLDDWSSLLTAAYILRIKAKGDKSMLDWATSLEDQATNAMMAYKQNSGAGSNDYSKVTRDDAKSVNAFNLDQQTVKNYETDD